MQGIAYHPKLISFLERARCDAFSQEGLTYGEIVKMGVGTVIADMQLKFIKPIQHQEDVYVVTKVVGQHRHSIFAHQCIVGVKPTEFPQLLSKLPDIRMVASVRLSFVDTATNVPLHSSHSLFSRLALVDGKQGYHPAIMNPMRVV